MWGRAAITFTPSAQYMHIVGELLDDLHLLVRAVVDVDELLDMLRGVVQRRRHDDDGIDVDLWWPVAGGVG